MTYELYLNIAIFFKEARMGKEADEHENISKTHIQQ